MRDRNNANVRTESPEDEPATGNRDQIAVRASALELVFDPTKDVRKFRDASGLRVHWAKNAELCQEHQATAPCQYYH